MSKDVLNLSKIEELSAEIGRENVPVLLEIFLGEMDSYVTNLSKIQGSEQVAYLKEISHALKSSAASFGADQLCELAITIDQKGKREQLIAQGDEVKEMLELLRSTSERYRVFGA